MKVKHNLKFGVCALLSMLCLISFATREKVLQIYKGGEVVQEFPISEIDYIEVNDIIEIPGSIEATVADNSITISWNKVEGASYNVYRSNDNVDFSLLAAEIEETSYTDQNPLRGTNYYKIKAVVNGRESNFSMAVAGVLQNSELPSGIYLGIYGFSRGFQTQPIECLSEENISDYHNFINGLSATQSFTWLYYAVDKSIDYMKSMVLPEDLSEVAIVTFTDGQDIGSLDELDNEEPGKYLSNSQYRDALNNRLGSEKVSNVSISAYTIGVLADRQGSSLTTFRNNMNSLATSAKNVFEVENLENLNHAFEQIANSLSETKYVQQFQLSISGHGEGELCRFTFDNVSSYQSSQLYIEGTYRRKDKALTDIKYVGLTSSSGAEVIGSFDNESGKYDYIFKDLKADDGTLIPTTNVQHWFTDENVWQDVDDEFYFNPDDASLEKIKRSAAIMLNLDCSKSMDGQKLTTLKEAANKFVQTLADNSVDPYEVASVRLDNTELLLPLGETATLTATVLPSTAKLKTVTWSSSNPSVATVDENGCVKAISMGSATITVATVDGGYTAKCEVTVKRLAQQIFLNIDSATIGKGESIQVVANIFPEDIENKSVRWESSDSNIATVNQEGLVSGINPGHTTITVSTLDGSNRKASCDISVVYSDFSSFSTTPEDLSLSVWKDEKRYFLTPQDYKYVRHDDLIIEGIVIIQGTEQFILNIEDEDCEEVYARAANSIYSGLLPSYNQAKIISAKWNAISDVLKELGFPPLSTGTVGYGYTQGYISCTRQSTTSDYYYIASPMDGEMITDGGYVHKVRKVKLLSDNQNNAIVWRSEYDLKLLISHNGMGGEWYTPEEYITLIKDNPEYEDWKRELRIDYGDSIFFMSVEDENCGEIKASTAKSLFSSSLPNYKEVVAISCRWNAINEQLEKYGFAPLLTGTVGYGYAQGYIGSDRPSSTSSYYYIATPKNGEIITDGGYSHRVRTVRR